MNISEKIETRRKQLNLSLQDVADYLGVSKTTVFFWESGRTKSLKLDHINRLAKILKVDAQSLFNDEEPLALVNDEKTLDMTSTDELDRELFVLVSKLPFKEKISLYNKLSKREEDKNGQESK